MQSLDFSFSQSSGDSKEETESLFKYFETYKEFVKMKTTDVISYKKSEKDKRVLKLRAEIKDELTKEVGVKRIHKTALRVPAKKYEANPFNAMGYTELSDVQERIRIDLKSINRCGAYAYSCSCGSGKTLGGIYAMYKLKLQTLIISTRNAVNDQWCGQLHRIYPELLICSELSFKDSALEDNIADVYILTPQYILHHAKDIKLRPGLIIFDEIHLITSPKFLQAMILPLLLVMQGCISELPYMIALSATFPEATTKPYQKIFKMFGHPIRCKSTITDIPVYVYDYYDHLDEKIHKNFDSKYPRMNDLQSLKHLLDLAIINGIDITSTDYKGIIMTYSIYTSILAGIMLHDMYDCNVLIIRTSGESALLLEKGKKYEYTNSLMDYRAILQDDIVSNLWGDNEEIEECEQENSELTTKLLINNGYGVNYKYREEGFNNISIIVGTVQRLKEGFSVQNITWGICTKFVWSEASRVQIIGRVRRNSDDPDLNSHQRFIFCYSTARPSTVKVPKHKRKGPVKWLYNSEYEKTLFQEENYIRI